MAGGREWLLCEQGRDANKTTAGMQDALQDEARKITKERIENK